MSPTRSTTIVTAGRFGAAVGDRIREHLGAAAPVDIGALDLAALGLDRHPIVLASSCEQPSRADAIDAFARERGRPWLAVVFEHPVIRIGPAIGATSGPCYRCFTRRRNQHSVLPEHLQTLHALYDGGYSLGPAGFLPHHVELAASIAARQVERLVEGGIEAGEVVLADVLSGRFATTRVVAVHACPRCGRRNRRNDTWASFARLVAPSAEAAAEPAG